MPRPPTIAVPMSSRPMPRSTIWPSPPTAIIEATTTIDSDIISVWLTPAMMVGIASGICALNRSWRGVAP